MNIATRALGALCIALLCALAAGCDGARDTPPPPATADAGSGADADADAATKKSFIGRQVAKALAEASDSLETENVRVGTTHVVVGGRRYYGTDQSTREMPRAEITPQGDFLVEDTPIQVDAAQRELLLEHRRNLIALARAGMAIGAQGADIAGVALDGLGGVIFGGDEGRRAYEQRMEAEAAKIEHEAARLCALLPALYGSQQALATSLPAFAPYATMRTTDIDDCDREVEDAIDTGAADGVHA